MLIASDLHRPPPAGATRVGKAYRITGGTALEGEVVLRGAKNAASKQILASLLTDEPCVLGNLPQSGEIHAVLAMLAELGTRHEWLDAGTLHIHTPAVRGYAVDRVHALTRLPLLMLGCLLHRGGRAHVPHPGGCAIGRRPINYHLRALSAMGARLLADESGVLASADCLHGATIELPFPSVGATENVLFAAVRARGTTLLKNAALEPELLDTIALLRKMGASIAVEGHRMLRIEGVRRLRGATHRVIPDRVEAASLAVAAAATGGRIRVRGARAEDLRAFLPVFARCGGGYDVESAGIAFYRCAAGGRGVRVETGPYPAFSTDWLLPLAVLLLQAGGPSVLHETVFETRLESLRALRQMGARVRLSPRCHGGGRCRFAGQGHRHSAAIFPSRLRAARLAAPDLRAGFAYLVAALCAEGTSQLRNVDRVERGYADLLPKLRSLGAKITADPWSDMHC